MFLNELKINVYFCTNLVELVKINPNSNLQMFFDWSHSKDLILNFSNLRCPDCTVYDHATINKCKKVLFDSNKYLISIKTKKNDQNLRVFNKNLPSQSYIFFTQTDLDLKNGPNNLVGESQYLKINSILDALENIGYHGFASFRATCQRIGKILFKIK